MSILNLFLVSSLAHVLGWTLVDFIWQGVGVGIIYTTLRYLLRRKAPALRYRLAMTTLLTLAILPIFTFLHLFPHMLAETAHAASQISTAASVGAGGQGILTASSRIEQLKTWLQPLVAWVCPLWFFGVLIMGLRVCRSWHHANRLRQTAKFMPLPEWNAIVHSLSRRFGISKMVRLAVSTDVNVPAVIGWLRPLILLPPSVLTGLTPLQIELILAHELAHIRRQDYLWNLLQVVMETLLFYHPVVRWVSQQARLEREQCCDDMVVSAHGNALDYARALTELESLRHPRAALLLGANGGQVLNRIHRLVGLPITSKASAWLPLLLMTGLLLTALLALVNCPRMPPAVLTQNYSLLGVSEQAVVAHGSVISEIQPTKISTNPVPAIHDLAPQVLTKKLPILQPVQTDLAAVPTPQSTQVTALTTHTEPVTSSHSDINHVGGEVMSRIAPVYPPLALERGIEGTATVEFTLSDMGEITDVHTTRVTGSRLFAQAAAVAIRQWRFTPVTKDGIAIAQHMAAEFVFNLHTPSNTDNSCKIPMGYHVCIKH